MGLFGSNLGQDLSGFFRGPSVLDLFNGDKKINNNNYYYYYYYYYFFFFFFFFFFKKPMWKKIM